MGLRSLAVGHRIASRSSRCQPGAADSGSYMSPSDSFQVGLRFASFKKKHMAPLTRSAARKLQGATPEAAGPQASLTPAVSNRSPCTTQKLFKGTRCDVRRCINRLGAPVTAVLHAALVALLAFVAAMGASCSSTLRLRIKAN